MAKSLDVLWQSSHAKAKTFRPTRGNDLFPLTLTLSLGEREQRASRRAKRRTVDCSPRQRTVHPLPKGEGWGEGEAARIGNYIHGSANNFLALPLARFGSAKLELTDAARGFCPSSSAHRILAARWRVSPRAAHGEGPRPQIPRADDNRPRRALWRD